MTDRVPTSPRLRFEVFKRDKFTCQYCGAKAPEVVLQADHIVPVAEGGPTDLLNLITSCAKCNGGKGAIPLSDSAAVTRQMDQLAELEERRQQLEMLLQWRSELASLDGQALDAVVQAIARRGGLLPNAAGEADLKRLMKRYSLPEILRAVEESFDTYLQFSGDQMIPESWERAFSKIGAVADILRQEQEKPYLRRLLYIQGIVRRRARMKRYRCVDYLEHVHLSGMSLDEIERRAKQMLSLDDFEVPLDAWLEQIGRPF